MTLLSLIVVTPFLSALLLAVVYLSDTKKDRFAFYVSVGILAPALSTLFSFIIAWQLGSQKSDVILQSKLFEWISLSDFQISLGFMADRLSVLMISFITFIGTLIHIYAAGYMKGDPGFGKFFSYFNLFMGSMLLLVLADNPIIMFVGWELVGLCSYLLIGFWYKDPLNVKAANKAFILNRVGDFGFIIALSILFVSLEGSGYSFIAIKEHLPTISATLLPLIGVLLFVGAMGKSAQIPLYVWLPDAMAGPTPVSALIHAATMVTAGVYMVARFSFLYNEIPQIGEFIAIIGAASALFAAIIAVYQTDIKKILAYSTMSQLGYMFIAVGLGAYSSGIFHVFAHAFFKALLFMGAGAVIIAMHHEQNIFKMGGLKDRMRVVYITMLIATLAISGIPPFAGFFSKDAILASAFASGHYLIWGIGILTAFLTAYYMFRLFFVVFYNKREKQESLQSLPGTMTKPLIVLAIGSALAGFLGVNSAYGGSDWIGSFLSLPDVKDHLSHSSEYLLALLNVTVASLGIWLAYKRFAVDAKAPDENVAWRKTVIHKFYIDEAYESLFVEPMRLMSVAFDRVIDNLIVDGVINAAVFGYRYAGIYFAQLQNGKVRYYALYILVGVAAISIFILVTLGGI